MRRFVIEFRKLVRLFRADPRALASGIIAPTALLLVFWITFGNMAPLNVAVINQDEGPRGAQLAAHILEQESPAGNRPYFVSPSSDSEEAFRLYEAGKIAGVVVISPDFSQRLDAGQQPAVDFHFNNYSSDMAKNMRLYLQEGIVAFYADELEGYDLRLEERFAVDSQVNWMDLISIGVFSLAFLIGSMFSLLYLIFTERVLGTTIDYALSPQSPWPFWLARLLFSLLLGALAASLNGLLIWLLTGLNVFALAGAILPSVLLVTGIWMGIAALLGLGMRQLAGAAAGAMAGVVIAWFLGGGPSPVRYLAGAQRVVAEVVPNTWALDLSRAAAFEYPLDGVLVRYLLLSLTFVVMMTLATLAYRRSFAHRGVRR